LKLERVIKLVLRRVKPNSDEREKIKKTTLFVKEQVSSEVEKRDFKAAVEVGGSVAKDTWVSGEADIDVFILFPEKTTQKMLEETGLHIAKEAMKAFPYKERYADHPFLEANINGIRVNIVPCYKVEKGDWKSAADRSPFHTEYVKTKLSQVDLRDEIRLLKRFIKGVGGYGAEIKIGGFSGYLCELLVLSYQSFLQTVNAISKWKLGQVIDIENYYKGNHHEALRYFDAPLIVIDPVDENRNVAAAVSREKLGELMAASTFFIEKPETAFFYPNQQILQTADVLTQKIRKSKLDLVFIIFRCEKEVPDVLWGQLYKTKRALKRLLKHYDFSVLRSSVWSDEDGLNVLIFELETKHIAPTKRHLGPPVDSKDAIEFLKKHLEAKNTTSGPWIEGNRWIVGISRRYIDSVDLLKDKLRNEASNLGIASKFIAYIKDATIYVNEEIMRFYRSNKEFAYHLSEFLNNKPNWSG
jgi:tRNA nucleotidyltransferase (CCA-adding enzyme)